MQNNVLWWFKLRLYGIPEILKPILPDNIVAMESYLNKLIILDYHKLFKSLRMKKGVIIYKTIIFS